MFGRERHATHGYRINKQRKVEPELRWQRATFAVQQSGGENTSNVHTEASLTFGFAAKSRPPRCKDTNDLIQDKHIAGR